MKINKIYNMEGIDFLEKMLKENKEESIDMFLCDLPYTYKGKQRVTANKWDTPIDLEKFFILTSKLLKKEGVMVLTATNPFAAKLINTPNELKNKFKNIDLVSYKYEWVWEKPNGSNFVHIKHQPFRTHELVLVFGKAATTYSKKGIYMYYDPQFTYDKPYTIKRDMSNVKNLEGFKGRTNTINEDGKRYPRSVQKFNAEKGLNPTQKPTDMFGYLIRTHCPKHGLVIDICGGSGTTAVSCIKNDRNYIINDKDEKAYNDIVERINEYRKSML